MTYDPILVVDDQQAILDDFAQLLAPADEHDDTALDDLAAALGTATAKPRRPAYPRYRLCPARQGLEALALHAQLLAANTPAAVAFVDIQMPPGIDGIETVARLWAAQPDLEVVLCTAYSDYSWHAILSHLGSSGQLVILRKPFDPIEVRQLAACLSEKWRRGREIARQVAQLEVQVREEVRRRLDVELRQAQKFEALGRLTAGIAHDINTPNQYVQANLEFFAESVAEMRASVDAGDMESTREILAGIPSALADAEEGVKRVSRIVRSVREFAHTTAAREMVDVDKQLALVAELARAQYRHDADIELDLGGVPPVPGRVDDLGRALLNLVINAGQAIRSAHRDRGRITLRSRATDAAVTIEVADDGCGIPRELWGRVFEPFFTTKPRGEGTGQGLALARETIVESHGGELTFDSHPGVGTTFRIALPRAAHDGMAA